MNTELPDADLTINPELVTEILCRFIRNEIHRAGFRTRGGRALRRHRLERGHVPLRRALGPENVLAVTMPYKTSSEATRRDSQAVIEQLGVQHARRADHRPDRRLFRPLSRRLAAAAGQQVRPRADDRALRPERGVRGAGGRHQQQERIAAWATARSSATWPRPSIRSAISTRRSSTNWPPTWACPSRSSHKAPDRRPVGRPDRRRRTGLHLRRGRSAAGADGRSPLAAGGTGRRPASRPSSSIAWPR